MRRTIAAVAATTLIALAPGAVPRAEASVAEWLFGAAFVLDGLHLRVGLHSYGHGYGPDPYFYVERPLYYDGYACGDACYRRGSRYYHHLDCPLIGYHFARLGYDVGSLIFSYAPRYWHDHYYDAYRYRRYGHDRYGHHGDYRYDRHRHDRYRYDRRYRYDDRHGYRAYPRDRYDRWNDRRYDRRGHRGHERYDRRHDDDRSRAYERDRGRSDRRRYEPRDRGRLDRGRLDRGRADERNRGRIDGRLHESRDRIDVERYKSRQRGGGDLRRSPRYERKLERMDRGRSRGGDQERGVRRRSRPD